MLRFRSLYLLAFLLLGANFVSILTEGTDVPLSPTTGGDDIDLLLNETDCQSEELPSGMVQVQCVLNEQESIRSLLETIIAAGFENLDRVAITLCRKSIDILEPLPEMRIRSLQISNCGINRVHGNAFDGMAESLEDLVLSNNNISTMPSFKKLRKLKSVNLNNNSLRDIPEGSFEGLEQLQQLRLKQNRICFILPNALTEIKPSLELLDLSKNCLTNVPAQNLKNFVNLSHLSLAGNQIGDVGPSQFVNLPNLVELRLSSNRIKGIATNAFVNVPHLKRFWARDNLLQVLDGQTLHSFEKLELVDISKNQLQKATSFKEFSDLAVIRMNSNKIKKIHSNTFVGNPKLAYIDLQDNLIAAVAKNAFSSNLVLATINLADNSFEFIERNMIDGQKGLKNLVLRNNSIADVNPNAFASTPDLVMIDLSENKLQKIRSGTFSKMPRIFLLDLSNNSLSTFERAAFESPIVNLFIDGNQLNCDRELDWFITYLVENNVKVFVPSRPMITCAAPPELANVSLKQIVMKKANESLTTSMGNEQGIDSKQPMSFLSKLLPGLTNKGMQGPGSIPALNSITQAFPSLREIPGLNFLDQKGGLGADNNFNAALRDFFDPLMNLVKGGSVDGDVNQLLESIPKLVVNIPGVGVVDISKLSPELIEHILKGGPVPGVPSDTLNTIVKQFMHRMYYAAAVNQGLTVEPDAEQIPEGIDHLKYLPPLSKLPRRFLNEVANGEPLPHLTRDQTDVVKRYYIGQIPEQNGGTKNNVTDELFSPRVVQMMKLLPPGYDMSKLSPEVMKSVLEGEMPDFFDLPDDLQQYLLKNLDKMIDSVASSPDVSMEEIIRKLPTFNFTIGSTFSPYDINAVEPGIADKQKDESYAQLYTALALGLVGTATAIVLGLFCYNIKVSRAASLNAIYD